MRRGKGIVGKPALLIPSGTIFPRPALGRGPTTAGERAKVIEVIRILELDPLNESAAASRESLLAWAIEVPEISFFRCNELFGSGLDNYSFAREFNEQVILSGVAFTLERQDKMRDATETYIAGVEGGLRMYEALKSSRPDGRSAFLDDLVAMRGPAELVDHITKLAVKNCPTSNTIFIALPAAVVFDLVLGALAGWLFVGRQRDRFSRPDDAKEKTRSRRLAKSAQWIVFGCAAYYAIVIAVLHLLEPDYGSRYRFLSEYQWSEHGWLMYSTFFILALAMLTLALTLRTLLLPTWSVCLGVGLLIIGAAGISIAGLFRASRFMTWAVRSVFPAFSWRHLLRVEFSKIIRLVCVRLAKSPDPNSDVNGIRAIRSRHLVAGLATAFIYCDVFVVDGHHRTSVCADWSLRTKNCA